MGDEGLLKDDRLRREFVQVRRVDVPGAVTPECVVTMLVREKDNQVPFAWKFRRLRIASRFQSEADGTECGSSNK